MCEGSGFMIAKKFELNTFLDLLKNQKVEAFLQRDRCCVSIDNFLLAAAFVFFKRANLTLEEFTVKNLWLALFLAHDAEEDEEPRKWEMLPWALGAGWQHHLKNLGRWRNRRSGEGSTTGYLCPRNSASR